MRLIYTVEINEDVYSLEGLLDSLDATVQLATDCSVERSRIVSLYEVCENGDWDDEVEETGDLEEEE